MEKNAPAVIERGMTVCEVEPLPTKVIVAQVQRIQEAMTAVMKSGVHYGTIPGCGDKPTLLKPGAEKICMMFRLHPELTVNREDLPGGHREYTITVALKDPGGAVMGQGVGSCSTLESKYRWRNSMIKCPTCGQATIRKSKYPPREDPTKAPGWYCHEKAGGCGAQFTAEDPAITKQPRGKAENPDIADQYNTVLKMAKKRAQVDATLTATAASDIFTQDVEDLAGQESGYVEAVVDAKPGNGNNGGPAPAQVQASKTQAPSDFHQPDTLEAPARWKLESPRSSQKGQTLAEIHEADPRWIDAVMNNPKRRDALTQRDRKHVLAFAAALERKEAREIIDGEFTDDEIPMGGETPLGEQMELGGEVD